jgi:hypothetical protein
MGRKAFRISFETAGLPKYLIDMEETRFLFLTGSFAGQFYKTALQDTRQYLTTREGGAENLQDLSETAGLPKYLIDMEAPGFFVAHSYTDR